MPRYRFDEFVLSPRRRLLLRDGRELPLIPRYFDLLVFLIERRGEAVHRRDIFERVWNDAIVSDSALSQAIRTIRRALGDDSREPRFVRTVSRHGYRFVFADVIEEDDSGEQPAGMAEHAAAPGSSGAVESPSELASEAGADSGHEAALFQELDAPAPWTGGAVSGGMGGGVAGALAGGIGGLILIAAPGGVASFAVVPMLAVIGGCCGAAGGAGVGAGIELAESRRPSRRASLLLVAGAALGGGLAGAAAQWLGRWSLVALVGVHVNTGGALEGLAIGGAAGFGLIIAERMTRRRGALTDADDDVDSRALRALVTALTCGLAAFALALAGRPLVGGTIHAIAKASAGSQATLTPLGHLIGEPDFGPVTAAVLATGEGVLFGAGVALGLRRAGKSPSIR